MPLPTFAFVERFIRPPGNSGAWADQIINKRVPVQETQQDPPFPIIQTRAWGIGKTMDHAWAHIWPYITLNLQSTPSIQNFNFAVPKTPSAYVIDMGIGAQNPLVARVNIDAPRTGAYGSKASVQAPVAYGLPPNYTNLMP